MPIPNLWFNFQIEAIELFLTRVFNVEDEYTSAFLNPESEIEYEHAGDVLMAYQEIVFRAVYFELNALIESELLNRARQIIESIGGKASKVYGRKEAGKTIEQHHGIKLADLPSYSDIEQIRKIANAYKHADGYSGEYEEFVPNAGFLFGYKEIKYKLDWESAHKSIQAVQEFVRALPGESQIMPRLKEEDAATLLKRKQAWDALKQTGALGHDFGEPVHVNDERGGFSATCQLCGESFWHEDPDALRTFAVIYPCPGMPGKDTDNAI